MGLKDYFKNKPKGQNQPEATSAPEQRATPALTSGSEMQALSALHFGSSRNSVSARSMMSTRSHHLDDIKHEVMANFLYQQQCSQMWISDQSGQLEGVVLRKSRGTYITCPSDLIRSEFHRACVTLNLHVGGSVYKIQLDQADRHWIRWQ